MNPPKERLHNAPPLPVYRPALFWPCMVRSLRHSLPSSYPLTQALVLAFFPSDTPRAWTFGHPLWITRCRTLLLASCNINIDSKFSRHNGLGKPYVIRLLVLPFLQERSSPPRSQTPLMIPVPCSISLSHPAVGMRPRKSTLACPVHTPAFRRI